MVSRANLGRMILKQNVRAAIATAAQVRRSKSPVTKALTRPVRSPELEAWFKEQAEKRLATLPTGVEGDTRKNALEMANRYPDGSMQPAELTEIMQMPDLLVSPGDIIDRAAQGKELLANNQRSEVLGTAARGIPGGGASSRAAKYARQNAERAASFGFSENTPRPLYTVGQQTLFEHTLGLSQHIARGVGKVFPNVVMSNSENVALFLEVIRARWGNYTTAELENTVLFNQIVLPRMWVDGAEMIKGKLYPAGHGDYPYLLAKYAMASALKDLGVKYLLFSNADEYIWQADPVMISIAQEMFDKGHHMLIVGVENTNNQFGGGFVKLANGTQSLVETPRLPWEMVKSGKAPLALNTTFYLIDVQYLASVEKQMLDVAKSLAVKEFPGREEGSIEQVIGIDSWAGDVFAATLNPAFVQFPRMNFLGIKDGSFTTGGTPVDHLGGRTYLHYVNEAAQRYPVIIDRLLAGDRAMAEALHSRGYSYLEPEIVA
jgi:UTP--glucose-1-phosphate uridylyltransferase